MVTFLNTENERVDKAVTLTFDKASYPAVLDVRNDSLFISATQPAFAGQLQLRGYDSQGRVFARSVSLPHKEKLNPFIERYTIIHEGRTRSITLLDRPDNLEIMANRTRDSLLILTENPRRILFRYFLFRNRNLIEQGETESLHLNRRAHPNDNYTLSVQYVWAGKPLSRDYEFPFDRKNLDIAIEHPSLVYPGQRTTFTVTVNDALGKPVPNADLTAFSVTRKFQLPATATVPSYSRVSGRRYVFNEFTKKEMDLGTDKILDYAYWRNVLGLDSIAFYKFLFPDTGYYEYRMPTETAQFAPFVVRNGNVSAVQVIYVDGQPVYYKNVGTLEPYSFTIKPGIHKIELRLRDAQLTVGRVRIDSAQKLIFSVDLNQLPGNCRTIEMPTSFTIEEVDKLSRYFILVRRNDRLPNAYIQQGGRYHLLGPGTNRYASAELTGPFYPGKATYYQKGTYHFTFDYEPFLSYEFKENTLKQKETDIGKRLAPKFPWDYTQPPSFIDQAHTPERIEAYWKSLERKRRVYFKRFPEFTPTRPGRLILDYKPVHGPDAVKAAFVLNLSNPDEYYVFPGSIREIPFNEGHYQAVVIFRDDHYIRFDSIFITPYAVNYYEINNTNIHPSDAFSTGILQMISKWSEEETYNMYNREQEMDRIRALYYQRSAGRYMFGHSVTGRVVDESGEPIPGVNVLVKGTAAGTVTDLDGSYTIHCPADGRLIFSFIGYGSQENEVAGRSELNVSLQPDVQQLSEVVVTGFGVQTRSFLTGSVTQALQGRLPGVVVVPGSGYQQRVVDSVAIRMRGVASTSDVAPLVILDGRIVTLSEIDKNLVTAIHVLKGKEAVAMYGSRAGNGVMLVSTRPGANKQYLYEMGRSVMMIAVMESVPGNSLRQNFRDYAFWKPRLITDENGQATFDATFPDDITGWNTYVLGMASRKRTGQTSSTLQSYKPLMAQISKPNFLIQGDEATAIGKITNYTQEKVRLQRSIRVNEDDPVSDSLEVENSRIDSISLRASGIDSISVLYAVVYGDYEDGELRKIPLYRKGAMETTGVFLALDRDTAITIRPNHPNGEWKIYAQADLLDVLMDEVRYLKNYPYDCNEQLASRIRGMLIEKQIRAYRGEKFTSERDLVKTIRKLTGHQNSDGSWSWWGTGKGEAWITLHAAQTLFLAEVAGYAMPFDKEASIGYLESELPYLRPGMRLNVMQFLLELGQNISVIDELDSLKKSTTSRTHDKLMAERLLQLQGKQPDWTWINSLKSETIKGNFYWGENRNDLYDNAVLNTLIVYRMGYEDKLKDHALSRIRNYFLEERGRTWRNTYESSLILEALLPALKDRKEGDRTTKVQLSGAVNKVIDRFPFEASTGNDGNLTVTKSGLSPVYFTAYQESWNPDPEKVSVDFGITTSFENEIEKFVAGKPVRLNVKVEVKRDAEYVLIEIPIPAGCSYADKSQSRSNGEVHREYFDNKTNIFCRYLKKGFYNYSINLLPRYSGKYTMNPAMVECMYFPTIFGREGVRRVEIE
ncbi:MAG TPA: carboxypeptidase-like regulatory domain-containing protein [Cyclobacteriaceae bacterium]|nr:carboxypeptidase-like regulatory domain-containing protein [Cyclobacteriaceae bacterium]